MAATGGSSSSRVTATGLALTMISVGVGVSSSSDTFALLLSFAGVLAGASLIFVGVRDSTPPMAATRGSSSSRATATGLALTMISVGVGVSSSSDTFALLLSFAEVLAGASLIFVGVRVADDATAPLGRRPGVVAAGVRCLRRNLALVGLFLASAAASTAADREVAPVLGYCAFALLLLGLSLLNIGVLLLGEEEH